MELYLNRQLFALVCSLLAGMVFGALYDLLRVLRQRSGAEAVPDVLFWLIVTGALFFLGMSAGDGSLHILMLGFTLTGFFAYMKLMSAAVFGLFDGAAELVLRLLLPVKKTLKRFFKFAGKCFFTLKNRIRMMKEQHRKDSDEDYEKHPETDGDHSDRADGLCRGDACIGAARAEGLRADDGGAQHGASKLRKRKQKALRKARKARNG